MSTTILQTKYYLGENQLASLIGAGKDTKLTWYVRNLTTNEFVNYTLMLHVKRKSGGSPLRLEFPEGTFQEGTELKCAVGDWDVLDENGRHCLQTAFFYIGEGGQAIPCKYGTLPSQNGGAIPELTQEYLDLCANPPEGPATPASTQTTLDAPAQTAQAPELMLDPITDFVACRNATGEIYNTTDCCNVFVAKNDLGEIDQCCGNCKNACKLYCER